MKLPGAVPVMILPDATLFPQALLPLHIVEPRDRRLLADALASDRLFCVAMQKPGTTRQSPMPVAGLGLIRVAVDHRDGTSHLILQGLARVALDAMVQQRPYRIHRIRLLEVPPCNDLVVHALVDKVRELLARRVELGLPLPFPVVAQSKLTATQPKTLPAFVGKDLLKCVNQLHNPEQVVDLVSCAVLARATERQTILETVNLEARLKRLIDYLLTELRAQQRQDQP